MLSPPETPLAARRPQPHSGRGSETAPERVHTYFREKARPVTGAGPRRRGGGPRVPDSPDPLRLGAQAWAGAEEVAPADLWSSLCCPVPCTLRSPASCLPSLSRSEVWPAGHPSPEGTLFSPPPKSDSALSRASAPLVLYAQVRLRKDPFRRGCPAQSNLENSVPFAPTLDTTLLSLGVSTCPSGHLSSFLAPAPHSASLIRNLALSLAEPIVLKMLGDHLRASPLGLLLPSHCTRRSWGEGSGRQATHSHLQPEAALSPALLRPVGYRC